MSPIFENPHSLFESRLTRFFRNAYIRFLKIRGRPREIALGLALGVFVGMTPLMGFHIVIAVFLSLLLGWNKISAAMGVWISNPVTALPLYTLTFYIGRETIRISTGIIISNQPDIFKVFTSVTGAFDFIVSILTHAPEIFVAMFIGGVVLGIPLAVITYYAAYGAIRNFRKKVAKKKTETG